MKMDVNNIHFHNLVDTVINLCLCISVNLVSFRYYCSFNNILNSFLFLFIYFILVNFSNFDVCNLFIDLLFIYFYKMSL